MEKIDISIKLIKKYIKRKTNNNPDIVFKSISFFNHELCVIFSDSSTSREIINDYVLEFLEEKQTGSINDVNILDFLESNIPIHKVIRIQNYDDLFYNLMSGFAIICTNGISEALALETKSSLNSDISTAQMETVVKGPKDAFTENFQTNLGLIRKRIKSETLWLDEFKVGKLSQTKIGILHMHGLASQELVDIVKDKISKINIDAVMDSNYIMELITGNRKNVFPTFLSTERPDLAAMQLLNGKIVIVVENTQLVIIIPTVFFDLFHSPEDSYQKVINANYTRIIRFIALFITLLTPAIYIAITTYNHEAIPSKLLINFSIQRDGVPFPSIMEALIMLITFEILKETDTRIPSVIGSSLSIVGALVLGEAAVTAGIVSPIMVIVIAITSISSFILSYFDAINGIRWWRLLFLSGSALAGILGIVIVGLLFIINLSSIKTLGVPYLIPIAPFKPKDFGDTIFTSTKNRFFRRSSYISKNNIIRGREQK